MRYLSEILSELALKMRDLENCVDKQWPKSQLADRVQELEYGIDRERLEAHSSVILPGWRPKEEERT